MFALVWLQYLKRKENTLQLTRIDVAMLQEILNHSTPQITLKYIGINQEEKDNILDIFYI
ncbi:hypothetical protein CO726_28910 [Bacillus fungorum]|uniref:Integrase n=1 Tax=Bacillus fungorum TaxID=2039284 RepID=A0A2G6Q5C9_9BACI|nr:hypothetical protein CO726_28910 [Bacillus fungorum]